MKWAKYLAGILIILLVTTVSGTGQEISDQGWPRMFESEGNKVVVHQPQVDEWEKYELVRGKAAVAVTLQETEEEYYGVLSLEANTETDFDTRTVLFKDFRITDLYFPNIEKKLADKCDKAVRDLLPKGKTLMVALDRVIAGLEITKERSKGIQVNLEPPPIFYSEQPAILVNFMGEPKLESVTGVSDLLYAVNTNWDILFELGSSRYFLLNGEGWLVTTDIIKGPWKAAKTLPGSFKKLPDDDNWNDVKKKIPGKPAKTIPRVFVSKKPSELIVTDGTPSYNPISGTKLLFVTNTDSDVFLDSSDAKFYFLTAGRWFKAGDLEGPWSSASEELPDDFKNIPSDHVKAHVLSSVPGTPDADAAVMLASVPRKATVNRKETNITVVYEGTPEFIVIDGTKTVYYAVNTPYSVFRVDKKYYAVHNGVWFYSSDPLGPWIVSSEVPDVIYTIPATHPKHNVTYVYVYDSTPDTVVVGYTSGYSGAYVAATGVIMFGLGYWIGHDDDHYHYHHYHHHAHFYAYGSAYRYDYYYGGYYRSARYYGPYGGAGGWSGYDPGSGTYYRGGYAHGPYGSAFAREAYNPYTDRYAGRAGAKTPYGSWGRTVVADGDDWVRAGHRSYKGRTVAGIETDEGGKAIAGYNRWTDQGAVVGKDRHGDVYVGRDGNVYKREGDTWQKNSGKGWKTVDESSARSNLETKSTPDRSRKPAGDSYTRDRQSSTQRMSGRSSFENLNRDYNFRQRGDQRTSNFRSRSSDRSWGGGSGRSSGRSRGGGGRGRR
jgi:hypothetical protein